MEDKIKEFIAARNILYAELFQLIFAHLENVKDNHVILSIKQDRGWISNVVDSGTINMPDANYDLADEDIRTIVVNTTVRPIPYLFFVDKELTKVIAYV